MDSAMLRKPRPLPQRFNRAVSPLTRKLVERRHQDQYKYKRQQWKRTKQRLQQKLLDMRGLLLRLAVVIVVGLILLVIGLALFSPILSVREIRVARTDLRLDTELIQQSLKPVFGQRMPILSVETIPPMLTAELPDRHRSAVPDLVSVTIVKVYPSTLQLRLALKPIAYRLSIDVPDQKKPAAVPDGSGSDFLTTDGMYVVYRNAQTASGQSLPLMHIVDWGVRPEPWKQLVSEELLSAMHEAGRVLATEFHQGVKSRTFYLRAREFHLALGSYDLWFDLKSPVYKQLERYALFLKNAPSGAAKSYVDLRVTGKVVYR